MKSRLSKPKFVLTAVAGLTASLFIGCGRSSPSTSQLEIVGGSEVKDSDMVTKHTVALVSPSGKTFCTGSLITPKHLVTAGHCLVNYRHEQLYVSFGPKAQVGSFRSTHLRVAELFEVHEDYNDEAMWRMSDPTPPADIALVQLKESAPLGFEPVRMLGERDRLYLNEPLLLAGFGKEKYDKPETGVLRQVVTKLADISEDKKELQYGWTPGKGACQGDSGGPAFVIRKKALALVGVTSRGPRDCNATGTYTDARRYRKWLGQTIKKAMER